MRPSVNLKNLKIKNIVSREKNLTLSGKK